MNQPKIKYDEISDTLTVTFVSGVEATGIELTEHILLRINTNEQKAISLVVFDYSVLTQTTEIGTRSFPLTGLSHLDEQLQAIVLNIVQNQPVRDYLRLSAYTVSLTETIPIIAVQTLPKIPVS